MSTLNETLENISPPDYITAQMHVAINCSLIAAMASFEPMPLNEPLVNAIQLQPAVTMKDDQQNFKISRKDNETDPVFNELEFDLNRPLKYFLKSVFKNGGKVVLAFPDSSVGQLKEVAEDIKEEFKPPWILSGILKIWYRIFPNRRLPEIDVEIVQIITTSVEEYIRNIRDEFHHPDIGRDPNINLVKLVSAETETEALTVEREEGGKVYFKHFQNLQELNEYSIFFRVEFNPLIESLETNIASSNDCIEENDVPNPVIMLINLKSLLPIGVNKDDELCAMLLEEPFSLTDARLTESDDIPDNVARPFSWLHSIIKQSSRESIFFYRQEGTETNSVIYPSAEPYANRRISKGDNDVAVIRDSNMEFSVYCVDLQI